VQRERAYHDALLDLATQWLARAAAGTLLELR